MPYTAFQAALDPLAPWGIDGGLFARGGYLAHFSDDAIDMFFAHAADLVTLSPPFSQMVIFRIAQAVAAIPEATAFSHRDANYLFHPITAWADPADEQQMIAATRAFAAAMRPFSTGASYLNFTHEADRVRDAYDANKYARLVALKDTYDPANLFRLNQNIRPSQGAEPVFASPLKPDGWPQAQACMRASGWLHRAGRRAPPVRLIRQHRGQASPAARRYAGHYRHPIR
jgi:hypothetical protein